MAAFNPHRIALLALAAAAVPVLAQLPSSALAEASTAQSQLFSILGIVSLSPEAASAEASLLTAEASIYASQTFAFSQDMATFSELATNSAARASYTSELLPLYPQIFGGASFSGTKAAASSATATPGPHGSSATGTSGTASISGTSGTSSTSPTPSTASKGAAPATNAGGAALGAVALAAAALL